MKDRFIFIDMKQREEAERRYLESIKTQLLRAQKKRGELTPDEQRELDRVKALLNQTGVVDPLFVGVRHLFNSNDGLLPGITVPDHKGGSLEIGALPGASPSAAAVAPAATGSKAASAGESVAVAPGSSGETAAGPGKGSAGSKAGAGRHPTHGGDPHPRPPIELDWQVQVAAVYGRLAADQVPLPRVLVGSTKPDEADPAYAGFTEAFFAAVGRLAPHKALARLVFPILVREADSERGVEDQVSATEFAQVLGYLVKRGVTAEERQLRRRVNEALDNIQRVGEDKPPSDIAIDLPDLEDNTDYEIVADHLRAMQAIYFSAMFEDLKVFQVVDKLVELFQNGVLPIGRGDAGNYLYRYWKEAPNRISEPERRNLYARTLGIPGGDDGGMPNREFNELWLRFVSAVSSYVRQINVDDLLRARIPATVSQQAVRKAGFDLAANLSLHGYGMAYFAATELQKQIKDVIALLSDYDIRQAYGARDMWQVIDQVATLDLGGARNSIRARTMATSGAIVMAWLAKNARQLSSLHFDRLLDPVEIQQPVPRASGQRATTDPTDYDLVNACEQWLAVTGTEDARVEMYAQPRESPMMTSKPIQIPSVARDLLEQAGVPSLGLGNGPAYRG